MGPVHHHWGCGGRPGDLHQALSACDGQAVEGHRLWWLQEWYPGECMCLYSSFTVPLARDLALPDTGRLTPRSLQVPDLVKEYMRGENMLDKYIT